jgi:hydroxyethylthiazole kinase-like uncharacterized protein yjeF
VKRPSPPPTTRAAPLTPLADAPAGPLGPSATLPSVDAETMRAVDRLAVEEFGISLVQMMELAGSHLAEVARLELGGSLAGRRIVVAAGSGHNGGGGLVAARHAQNRGARVQVVLARPVNRLAPATRAQVATLVEMGVPCCVADYDLTPAALDELLAAADLLIDAVLGYGTLGPLRPEVAGLLERLQAAGRPILSLDLPSGVDPDSGEPAGAAVRAAATMTVALPKRGLLTETGRRHAGRLYLADIGLPRALYSRLGLEVDGIFAAGRVVVLREVR